MGQLDTSKRVPHGFQGEDGGKGGGVFGCVMWFLREQQMEGKGRGETDPVPGLSGVQGSQQRRREPAATFKLSPKKSSGPRQQNQKLGLPDGGGTEHVQYDLVYSM